jgi:hypothetical protein
MSFFGQSFFLSFSPILLRGQDQLIMVPYPKFFRPLACVFSSVFRLAFKAPDCISSLSFCLFSASRSSSTTLCRSAILCASISAWRNSSWCLASSSATSSSRLRPDVKLQQACAFLRPAVSPRPIALPPWLSPSLHPPTSSSRARLGAVLQRFYVSNSSRRLASSSYHFAPSSARCSNSASMRCFSAWRLSSNVLPHPQASSF